MSERLCTFRKVICTALDDENRRLVARLGPVDGEATATYDERAAAAAAILRASTRPDQVPDLEAVARSHRMAGWVATTAAVILVASLLLVLFTISNLTAEDPPTTIAPTTTEGEVAIAPTRG